MSFYIENGILYKKDGTLVGRIERGAVSDNLGNPFLFVKGNELSNNYGSVIAKVEKGQIISASGGVLAKLSDARKDIDKCNALSDVDVAALWLPFVKGIK